jgi:hypothetical protein
LRIKKDYRDNKIVPQGPPGINGTTGATGATDPQGPQRIQGLIGPNQIDPALLYQATTNTNISQFVTISNATCDPGDVVVEGGSVIADQHDTDVYIESPSDNGNNIVHWQQDDLLLLCLLQQSALTIYP